jgi:transcriptional regulator with XRE-family HTH domain
LLIYYQERNGRVLGVVLDAKKVISSVGHRVAELREAAGLTQQQLADASGMDPANLRPIEAGRRNMTLKTLVSLANALRCSIEDLLVPTKRPARRAGRPRKR